MQSDSDLVDHCLEIDSVKFECFRKRTYYGACTAGGVLLAFVFVVRIINLYHNTSPLWRFQYSTTKNLIFLNCFKKIILLFDYKITFI